MHVIARRHALLGVLALLGAQALAQAPAKPIGFALQIRTEGLFSRTVAKVVVTEVTPGSQAHAAGLAVDDELLEVQGIPVPGNSASVLEPHIEFVPGEPKKLVFKRPGGQKFEATLTRAAP